MKKKHASPSKKHLWSIPAFKDRSFLFGSAAIIAIAAIFRFYDYAHRWVFASDQAGFAIVARYALLHREFPLLGPFSSAGPFQTGGEWYWIVMLGKLLYFPALTSPWVFLTLLSILFVGVMIFLGSTLATRKFGLLVGLLTALSTGEIIQAQNLTNQTPLMLFSAWALYHAIMYSREQKIRELFFLGLAVGIAATIHLQGVALGIIIIMTVLLNKIKNPVAYLIIGGGILLPWLPVVVVDAQNHFYTFSNMIRYYFFNTAPIPYEALGRRWMTFAGVFVPAAWSYTIGGIPAIGYGLIFLSSLVFLGQVIKKQLTKDWLLIFLSLAAMVFLLRYTRTPIFESYFVFLHPLILLITAWALYKTLLYNKWLGGLLITLVLTGTITRNVMEVPRQIAVSNAEKVEKSGEFLKKKFPGEKFALYDYRYRSTEFSLPLTLSLYEADLLDPKGRKIGIARYYNKSDRDSFPNTPMSRTAPQAILDLNSSESAALLKGEWVSTDPEVIYHSVQRWYQNPH